MQRVYDGKKHHVPALHMVSDMHSVEFGFLKWAIQRTGMRGTIVFDRFHGVHNAVDEGVQKAGLTMAVMEWRVFLDCRRKPFDGCGNHAALLESMEELREQSSSRNMLFRVLASGIASDFGIQEPDGDEEEFFEEVWQTCHREFLKEGIGEEAKPSRWFASQRRARSCEQQRYSTLLAILWLGYKRKWWKTIDDTPLLRNQQLCPEVVIADHAPAEALAPIAGDLAAAGHVPAEGAEEGDGEGEPEGEEEDALPVQTREQARKSLAEVRKSMAKVLHFTARVLSSTLKRPRCMYDTLFCPRGYFLNFQTGSNGNECF